MVTVRVYVHVLSDMYMLLEELKQAGLTIHNDFEFSYTPPFYDYTTGEKIRRYVEFSFYNEKHATLFTIKYANNG